MGHSLDRSDVLTSMNRLNAAAQVLGPRFMLTHQRAALFCMKWCNGCYLEIM